MILEEETYEKFGYYPSELKPKSHKRIFVECDKCGRIRVLKKEDYRPLCKSCSQKGKKLTRETREKVSAAKKGIPKSRETIEKMRQNHICKVGPDNPLYGRTKKPQLSDYNWLYKKYWEEKLSTLEIGKLIGCCDTSVRNALMRFGIRRRTTSEAGKGKKIKYPELWNRDWLVQKYQIERYTQAEIAKIIGGHICKVQRAFKHYNIPGRSYSERVKMMWANPIYARNVMKSAHASPNKLERLVNKLLQELAPGEWRYNGNLECGVMIGGLIPDFVNVNGKKAFIEVFGEPYHDPNRSFLKFIPWHRQEFGRRAIYSQCGYKCIIFWNNRLLRKDAKDFVLNTLKEEGVI